MQASVRVCILDGTPPQESACYQTLLEILGSGAERWVDEVTVNLNHPPPEVMPSDRIRVPGVAMEAKRKHQLSSGDRVSSQAKHPDPIQTFGVG